MKKLIALAAIATCGAALAVESANIVGYQTLTLTKGYSFFTVTFKSIGAESIDIQSIESCQVDGSAWKTSGSGNTKCAGAIKIQKVDAEGSYLDQYNYYSTKDPQGWYTMDGTYVEKGTITLATGEGLIINNTHQVGACLKVSGEVNLQPARVLPKGYSFCGNFTPVAIDLQDISSTQVDGTEWKTSGSGNTKCAGAVKIQKVDAEGSYLDQYNYYSTKNPQGWYTMDGEYIAKGTVSFGPGEGFIVNNTHQVGARLVLPAPVQ